METVSLPHAQGKCFNGSFSDYKETQYFDEILSEWFAGPDTGLANGGYGGAVISENEIFAAGGDPWGGLPYISNVLVGNVETGVHLLSMCFRTRNKNHVFFPQ